ncbi:DUF2971 domain-containing protein [Faecalibacillus intestinalis]|uniref:DUF2971 domain-containing protein n=1 Tax=Faecalibacillus intestinalis TaxID=1982626 RepID=UPI0039939ED3
MKVFNKAEQDRIFYDYIQKLRDDKTDKNIKSIYHYTSPKGLHNILKDNCLWLSDIHYLNDEEELLYATSLAQAIAKEMYITDKSEFLKAIIEDTISPSTRFPIETLYDGVTPEIEKYIQNKKSKNLKFIACFSIDKDNLPLWNYYSKSENKTGYNIEFDKEMLINNISNTFDKSIHGKVIYNSKQQRIRLTEIISDCNNCYKNHCRYDKEKDDCKTMYWDLLDWYCLFYKNESFKSEEEYRIVVDMNNFKEPFKCKEFRECNGFFIPYIKTYFEKNIIKSITISPTQKEKIVKNSIEQLTDCFDYDVIVNNSKIPLRY